MERLVKISNRTKRGSIFLTAILPLFAVGCGVIGDDSAKPAPLDSAFARTSAGVDARRGPSNDRSGLINETTVRPDPGESQSAPSNAKGRPVRDLLPTDARPNGVSDAVNDGVVSPRAAATMRSGINPESGVTAPAPASIATSDTGGRSNAVPAANQTPTQAKYLQLGSVVVEVNGRPIFANKVIDTIAPVLSARAKQVDEAHFRDVALKEITTQVRDLIRSELEYAAAERNLDQSGKNLADALTQRWRNSQIQKAGGSLQLARQKAAQQGLDFDDLVTDQFRVEMRRVYFQTKEFPKIQITANDMREYYTRHKTDNFTVSDAAKFRVIKINGGPAGDDGAAVVKINDLRKRAESGEDFETLAGTDNDDTYLKHTHGDVTGNGSWIDKGAYAVSNLEDAVWAIQPGQITPVIHNGPAYYIARLETKRNQSTKSFDDDDVQERIRETLTKEQFNALRDATLGRLMKNAIVYPDPPMFTPALEMAMQKYAIWSVK